MIRILNRQKRLSVSRAVELTGFETERCRLALEGLLSKGYVKLESSEYWITAEGTGYLAFSKSAQNRRFSGR